MSGSMERETLEDLIENTGARIRNFNLGKSDHPIVLALTTDMNSELIDRCGNIVIFYGLLLDAAMEYFDPSEESRVYIFSGALKYRSWNGNGNHSRRRFFCDLATISEVARI